jgi:GAF domain-containing protein/HAMP domain-containing protein
MAVARKPATSPQTDEARYRGGLARTLVGTLLVFTFIPLALMGGAAYLRTRTLLRDQVVGQMQAQISDQVGQVELAIKTKEIRLDRLVRSPDFISKIVQVLSTPPGQLSSLRDEFTQQFRAVNPEVGRATFNQYLLVKADGTILMASNPAWEGQSLSGVPAFKDLMSGEHVSLAEFDARPLYPNQLVLFTVSQAVAANGAPLATLIGVTESQELQNILLNLATASSGAQALFVTPTGTIIGNDPYTNEMAAVEAPPSEVTPIMNALNGLMNQTDAKPVSVDVTRQDGSRAFGQVLWLSSLQTGIVYEIDENRVFGALNSLIPFTVAILLAALAAMGIVLSLGARRVFRPLAGLADITKRFSDGDFTQRAEVRSKDEIGLLARSFNHMAEELSDLYRSLEGKVEERTRQIRTAADVAQRITSTSNLNELLTRTVQLIIEQFDFYQASVFLLDRAGRNAILQASYGPAAAQLLARGHRLEVGSSSIIGWVSANNQPRIASDVAEDPMHLKNELLPETRSEVGIPISAGGTVLGAIDVQSTKAGAFGPETVVMLQILANQIAVAIQNMSLVASSQFNFQELERLLGASHRIAASQTRTGAFETAARLLRDSPTPALLFSMHEGRLRLERSSLREGSDLSAQLGGDPNLTADLNQVPAALPQEPVIVDIAAAGGPETLTAAARQLGYRSAAFLPLWSGKDLGGLMILGDSKRRLTQTLIEPYISFADLLEATLTRIDIVNDKDRQLAERDSLTAISQAVASSTAELPKFFQELHAQVRKNIGDYAFLVALYDPTSDVVSIPYAFEEGQVTAIQAFPLGEGLTSILIRSGQPLLLVEDVERQALKLGAKLVGKPAQSWMGAPMKVGGQPIGALIIQDVRHEKAFNEDNLRFFAQLADQVAAVIHNAQLLDESRAHTFQLETAAEIARDVSASLNLDELLAKAVTYIGERLHFSHAAIFLLDARGENALVREATGEAGAQMKRTGHKLAVGSRSIVGFVSGRGEPLIVNDTTKDATYLPNPLLPETRSEAAVPLKVGERIVGVMDVQSTEPFAFNPDDVRTLQILADQLGVAVVNSELFAETQEHLSQHRLLHHITTSAASGTTLGEALDSAVQGLQVTLGGDRVAIMLADRELKSLVVEAAVGYSDEMMGRKIPIGSGITGWSAAHRRPLRVDDVTGDARYIQASPNTRSEMAVPLIYRNEVLGVLNVESEQPGAYTENDEEMLGTLAGSLAAIIANARLLTQVRAQAERERALFEITGKIRRATDIQSILATTAGELTKALGARRAEIKVSTEENGRSGEETVP